jgi:hypothetical protein
MLAAGGWRILSKIRDIVPLQDLHGVVGSRPAHWARGGWSAEQVRAIQTTNLSKIHHEMKPADQEQLCFGNCPAHAGGPTMGLEEAINAYVDIWSPTVKR